MTGVKRGYGHFTGAAGLVHWRAWHPDAPAIAIAVIVHGVAEHSGRYDHLGTRLAESGYAVYAADHHGHGRSAGSKAYIRRMSTLTSDVDRMLRLAGELVPDRPRFLIGHSMGSLVTLDLITTTQPDLAGVVLSGTPLILPPVAPALRKLAPVLSVVAPKLGALKLNSCDVSRDPFVVDDYDNDPLNYRGKLPARTGAEIVKTSEMAQRRLSGYSYPTLLLHGSADRVSDPAAVAMMRRDVAPDVDLTTKVYPGLYHEVFNEPERDEVIDDVLTWLTARLSPHHSR